MHMELLSKLEIAKVEELNKMVVGAVAEVGREFEAVVEVEELHIIQLCRRSVSIFCFKRKLNYKKHTKEMHDTFLQKSHSPKSVSKR
ncbi:hypothetical protein Sjap_016088 [Stephania japonica]|uniref:Uncharacterized protein n=1 Tax=Stephania japonica TaxID=461633 RepID=A0AAP0IKD0_9MAGN